MSTSMSSPAHAPPAQGDPSLHGGSADPTRHVAPTDDDDDTADKRKRETADEGDRDPKKQELGAADLTTTTTTSDTEQRKADEKRKKTDGARDQTKMEEDEKDGSSTRGGRKSIKEMGFYMMDGAAVRRPAVDLREDLFELYGLSDLALEVAREKPNGEKNALRKTYKGHMRRLGVAGNFDVAKKPEGSPSDLLGMCQVPEHEWYVHQVQGKDVADGLSETTLSVMPKALAMAKGPIPKSVWDVSVLGDLTHATDPSKMNPATPGTPLGTKTNPAADPSRPRRNIKKRSFGDGFPDDDADGYSTGDGEAGQKRRRKDAPPAVVAGRPTI